MSVGLPYSDLDTSLNAAIRCRKAAKAQRQRIIELLFERPSTDEEIGEILGLPLNAVHPRRWQLVRDGIVVDSGERRPTRAGFPAIVWRLK